MKVAIVGFAQEGRAALAYWQKRGAEVTVCDQNEQAEIPFEVDRQLGVTYLQNLDRFDVIMRSAGINPDIILKDNPTVRPKITTVVNEFLRVCPTRNTIGVTGTKGKGTTSTLITKMLQAAGKQVFLGGNIGVAPFEFLDKITSDSWVVLELSSFQLSDLTHSPSIGLCLMVVPEHLNWHKDMDDYILAKAHMFEHQTTRDLAIYYARSDDSRTVTSYSPALKIPYFADPGAYVKDGAITIANAEICQVSELKLLGEHNWQNVCAAVTVVWQITQDVTALRRVLTTFAGLEHRLELVREVNGVTYYDDSFGTTPEAAQVAVEAFKQSKVLILGGSDKGVSFDDLVKTVANSNVHQVVLMGATAPKIEAALRGQDFTNITSGGNTMGEVVATAQRLAQSGDVVLLSPACASFGMFKDYKERAAQFVAAVQALN
jgi:UDP-N-acetylmuramoylalanine--D-glutamate ligase